MEPNVTVKFQQILQGDLKYTSSNLGLNMLITKMQKRVAEDPDSMDDCIMELTEFTTRFPIIAAIEYPKILAL